MYFQRLYSGLRKGRHFLLLKWRLFLFQKKQKNRNSACLVLQAQSQLKAIHKDNADTIIGNMDASIFLSGKEPSTRKELAAVLDKETIDTYNTGESRGRETSHSQLSEIWEKLMS